MSEELKINIPLFNIGEKAELENKLSFHLDEFTNEIMKTMTRDKEIIILKKVIEKQQKEIEEKAKNKDYISKDKIRELIKEKAKTDTYNFRTITVKDIEELLEEK